MSSPLAEPSPETLAGRTPGAVFKRLFLATRPKFLTASLLPVIVGFAWGYGAGARLDAVVVILALVATALVHAASNVYNDVGDDINGTDPDNAGRIHPYTGGSRFIQNGVMSRAEVARFSGLLFALAVVVGGALVVLKGLMVLWLGVAGIVLGVAYSMPRVQLSAHGLGELAVAVAFGVLPVSGAGWLATGQVDATLLWVSLAVGLWVTAILQINEVPDIAADTKAGKRTLAVRFGPRGVAYLYFGMHLGAFLILVGLVVAGRMSVWVLLLPALLVVAAARAARTILPPSTGIVGGIEMTLAIQLLGCLWLVGWFGFFA